MGKPTPLGAPFDGSSNGFGSTLMSRSYSRTKMIFGEAAENSTRAACAPLLLRRFCQVSLNVTVRFHILPCRCRSWIERDIAEALQLIAFFRARIRKCGFAFCIHYFPANSSL